ncbi:biotin transporter BioY [Paracoccus sp. p4-l81]|uniref:biotin transporter BioY n=1 Tax=unclassified Paracoccus (in: a-proteobacteria) TaxID=2688777 RepID=UPI0035B9766A
MTSSAMATGRPIYLARGFAVALLGAVLITLGAKVQIPFWPVPMTLHTLAVFLLAATLGPRLGMAAMAAYLTAGAAGLPVFSGSPERGIGLAYMAGPTGGYLAGFLLGAGLTGWLVKARGMGAGLPGRFLAMLAGLVPVYALGLAWLAAFVPMSSLLTAGLTPFILGDLVKLALAALLAGGLSRLRAARP